MGSTVEENEIAYHRTIALEARKSLAKVDEAIIARYRKTDHWRLFEKEYVFKCLRELAAAKSPEILTVGDFGCGDGSHCCEAARIIDNALFIGFDLSPDLIEVARERAELNGVTEKTNFFVANAENNDPLQGRQVDVMLCLSILHHVQLDTVVPNLLSATKPGGTIIIREPVAFSSGLQKVRDMSGVPKDVSPDERQLSEEEITYLLTLIENPTVQYSRLFSRLSRFFPNLNKIDAGHPYTRAAIHFLHRLDYVLVGLIPPLRKFCGRVVITGQKPV